MPSEGGHYYMSQHKLAEVLMYLSDMMLDGRMSEEDYNKIIPMVTEADEEAFHQTLYVVERVGYDDMQVTGVYTEPERAYKNMGINPENDLPDIVTQFRLNDPEYQSVMVDITIDEDGYGVVE